MSVPYTIYYQKRAKFARMHDKVNTDVEVIWVDPEGRR